VYKRHRPIPSRIELAGQRQQSWKSVERWPPRNASEPLRYVAMPELPPATQRRSWPFVPSKDCQRDYGPQTGFPQPQQLLGARSCARCQPMQCRGLQPAAITVGPKSVTAAITLALRRLTGDHRPHAS
jgi:hypothetical protein